MAGTAQKVYLQRPPEVNLPEEPLLRDAAVEYSCAGMQKVLYITLTAIMRIEKISQSTMYKRVKDGNLLLVSGLPDDLGSAIPLEAYIAFRKNQAEPEELSARDVLLALARQALSSDSAELKAAALKAAPYIVDPPARKVE